MQENMTLNKHINSYDERSQTKIYQAKKKIKAQRIFHIKFLQMNYL